MRAQPHGPRRPQQWHVTALPAPALTYNPRQRYQMRCRADNTARVWTVFPVPYLSPVQAGFSYFAAWHAHARSLRRPAPAAARDRLTDASAASPVGFATSPGCAISPGTWRRGAAGAMKDITPGGSGGPGRGSGCGSAAAAAPPVAARSLIRLMSGCTGTCRVQKNTSDTCHAAC